MTRFESSPTAMQRDCEVNAMDVKKSKIFTPRFPTNGLTRLARLMALTAFLFAAFAPAITPASADDATAPVKVAFLGVRLQNDNEGLDPTSDTERARQVKLQDLFKTLLEEGGHFKFIATTPAVIEKIAKGQNVGECNGCEVDYGKEMGGDRIAWITVQKISNLILNMNVYMADVETKKMTYIKSVDIRGNTDESWLRSLTYLMKNYFDAK